MICEKSRELIDTYVEGALDDSAVREIEAHHRGCVACREEERRARALRAEVAALPRSIDPARDLWGGVADRLERRQGGNVVAFPAKPAARAPVTWKRALAAASIVLVAGAAVVISRRPSAPPGAATPVAPGGTSPLTGMAPVAIPAALPSGLGSAELSFMEARQELRAALFQRKESLSPETINTVNQNLKIIEDAIQEIESALSRDPGNRALRNMLTATKQREVALLRQVTQTASLR